MAQLNFKKMYLISSEKFNALKGLSNQNTKDSIITHTNKCNTL